MDDPSRGPLPEAPSEPTPAAACADGACDASRPPTVVSLVHWEAMVAAAPPRARVDAELLELGWPTPETT